MCGRLACGLKPDEISNCCSYKKPGDGQFVKPSWKNINNSGKTYKPSYNICPTEVAPVLISGNYFDSDTRMLAPMIFGLIPSWSKADTTTRYSTINCRIESVKTSKLYGPLLQKGQRCIVICNGFFEWKKESKKNATPYFIHSEQNPDVVIDNPTTWNLDFETQKEGKGFRPLKLAALFEKHKNDNEEEVFSFTIITKESSSKMSWLHLRMPAIIDTEEQLHVWLDAQQFDGDFALQYLSHFEKVVWYPVSAAVNSSANKDVKCLEQMNVLNNKVEKRNSSNFLENWLTKRPRNSETNEEKSEDLEIKKELHK